MESPLDGDNYGQSNEARSKGMNMNAFISHASITFQGEGLYDSRGFSQFRK